MKPIHPKLNLFFNILATIITQASSIVVGVILTPLLINRLSKDEYGLYVSGVSLSSFAFVIVDLGMALYLIKEVSEHREDPKYVGKLLSASFLIKIPILLLSLAIFVLLAPPHHFFSYAVPFWLFLVATSLQPNWLFQGIEALKIITFATVLSKLVMLAVIYFFVHSSAEFYLVTYTLGLSSIVCMIFSLIYSKWRGYGFTLCHYADMTFLLKNAMGFYAPRVMVAMYTQASVFIVSRVAGTSEAAVYAVADQFYKLGQMAIAAVTQAFYPFMVFRKDVRFLLMTCSALMVVAFIACALLWGWVDDVIYWYVGEGFETAVILVKIFMIACLFIVPSSFLGFPLLGSLGFHRVANQTLMIGASFYSIGLAVLYVTGHVMALYIALLTLLAEVTVFLLRAYKSFYLLKKNK
ncbi:MULTISPECIES: oligosaccharide flippase family protein [unclassified Brenneria]|uniref:oligosaccharide flippase family protein n=1 Tax=unclassified Brenneria TaxID=2634434 RepID=UPI0018F0C71C|nr:oligosaccharide flippase family protein [Brenneria sp. L3-3C-1]MBJ7221600.1 oligosaccharide flippase family protein [Brenneria sp. L3-3C-1]MEE3642842.1 oligosaccharide flippase family protein [Brenneria sp. L3_3C_1]